ncbi:hypothetical protein [Shewanella frigidimarina]|jgi:hypothetical protein|uniref:hypothetical protein n=1 Tax=Shewanella frigidimarina TaxID=56812 RepID=UPI003D79D420
MIWESCYWKEPLLKSATWLVRMRLRPNSGEPLLVKLEKELMMGFYAIRKLLDTAKITDATKASKYSVNWFPNLHIVDYLNWDSIDRLFDLDEKNQEDRDIRFLCDRFVHSYIFIPDFEDNGKFLGVYVATDRDRKKKLYFVTAETIVSIFRLVGRDYPSSSRFKLNPNTGEREPYDVR